jgi:hypothetical protein
VQGATSRQAGTRAHVLAVVALACLPGSPRRGPLTAAASISKGADPEALYTRVTVEQVSISGCRARLALELYYPGGRRLHYVASWVRPFDRSGISHDRPRASLGQHPTLGALAADQYAPWLFVGDNRVGGVDTPCGV